MGETSGELADYQVWITGGLLLPIPHGKAISAFAELLAISHDDALSMFARAPCMVRSGLHHEDAVKYLRVLQRKGIGCEVLRQG